MRVAFLLATLLAFAASGHAATITVVNNDGANEGFNDPTPVSAVGGNPGTTLGAQRLNAFSNAAAIWGAQLSSAVPVRVASTMDGLSCSASSATLGSAGAVTVHANFSNAPYSDTYFPQALANKLAGTDLSAANDDIVAQFNSAIGTTCSFPLVWYYGLDGNPGPSEIDFVAVVLHELGHGLGFQTFVSLASGARLNNRDDVYMKFLEDHDSGLGWPSMTNAERAASAKDDTNLHWTGSAVVAAGTILSGGRHASGHVQMYAPNPLQSGSSVSHFDTDCTPNELMEPFYTSALDDPSLARDLMTDIGWDLTSPTSTSTSSSTSSTSTSSTSSSTSSSSSTTVPTTSSTSSSTSTSTSSTSTSTSTTSSSSTSSTSTSSTSAPGATSTSTSTTAPAATSSSTSTSSLPSTSTSSSTSSSSPTSTSTTTTLVDQGAGLCPASPSTVCRTSVSQRSLLRIRRGLTSAKNLLKWKVVRGGRASFQELRNPEGAEPSLAVCMYDASGSAQPLLASAVLPGGTCGAGPCWKRLPGGGGYRYRNRAGAPDGVSHLKLRLSRGGDVQLVLKGRGANLKLPSLGLVMPVRMQLLIGDITGTTCWDSSFTSATRNDSTTFKANGS